MNLSKNKILITGGATGIGLGLTKRFLAEDNVVIICGRREDILIEVTDLYPNVITRQCDLSLETERQSLFDWIVAEHSDLNVLVNNAGIQNWIDITQEDFYRKAELEVAINILAPIHLITLFTRLNSLKTIINVTSGLAFAPLAKVPVYCATKAFFHSFTQTSRYLLKAKDIEVIEIIPPALNTDLGGKGLHDQHPPVEEFINSIFEQLKEKKSELTFGFSSMISNADQQVLRELFIKMNAG